MIGELPELHGRPARGRTSRGPAARAYLTSWTRQRAVESGPGGGGLIATLGSAGVNALRRRVTRRLARNVSSAAPLLLGAGLAARSNRTATGRLAEARPRPTCAHPSGTAPRPVSSRAGGPPRRCSWRCRSPSPRAPSSLRTHCPGTPVPTWPSPTTSSWPRTSGRWCGTGVAVAIPEGYAGFVHPRSGLAHRVGLGMVNAPGTIDAGYRGEIKVNLVNTDPVTTIRLRRGDRVAQLVVQPVVRARFVEVGALPSSLRGDGGYGSTGGFTSSGGRDPARSAPTPEEPRP